MIEPSNIHSLKFQDPDVASSTLFLGFSFSLMADGAAGSYNFNIAKHLGRDISQSTGFEHHHIGMQWEIFDAMSQLDPAQAQYLESDASKVSIAPPPSVAKSELDERAFIEQLKTGATRSQRILREQLSLVNSRWSESGQLMHSLNNMLGQVNLFQVFHDTLELHDLHRTVLAGVGSEKRTLPSIGDYPDGLARYQARRINRLIIEATCPDVSVLKPGKYLSTKGVLDLVLERFSDTKSDIKQVCIYAHPQHGGRCREQTITSLAERGWKIPNLSVFDMHQGQEWPWSQDWPWDRNTAQVWCRSEENWLDYERLVKKLMSATSRS